MSTNKITFDELNQLADDLLEYVVEVTDLSFFDINKLKLIANLKSDKEQLYGPGFLKFKWLHDEAPNSITKNELLDIDFNKLTSILCLEDKEICMPMVVAFSIIECIHLHYHSCHVIFHYNGDEGDNNTDVYIYNKN